MLLAWDFTGCRPGRQHFRGRLLLRQEAKAERGRDIEEVLPRCTRPPQMPLVAYNLYGIG